MAVASLVVSICAIFVSVSVFAYTVRHNRQVSVVAIHLAANSIYAQSGPGTVDIWNHSGAPISDVCLRVGDALQKPAEVTIGPGESYTWHFVGDAVVDIDEVVVFSFADAGRASWSRQGNDAARLLGRDSR